MLRSLGLFTLIACAIALAWYGLGRPVAMPPSPLGPGEKLTCISYAPFHGDQAPFTGDLRISDAQIAEDLRRLSALTACVRTYSAKGAQGRITRLAEAQGLTVLQGIWLGRNRADNRREIEAGLQLARRHPGTVKALIVGNETLLRGELAPATVGTYLAEVKRRSGLPVTYADVWEFWLKSPELASAADFVTIHILPYWEDDPVSAKDAVAHVREVRDRVQATFPGKEIWIGEVGWPSAGRMREGALPSPANQARVLSDVVAAAKQDGWKVNLIEAFDQPWKRLMEGTVGGYWGVYGDQGRKPKFQFGQSISNHPDWRLKAGLGIGAAFFVFVAFWLGSRKAPTRARSWQLDAAASIIALGVGLVFGLAVTNLPMEGEVASDRVRSVAMLVLALVVPAASAYALARGDRLAGLAEALDPARWHRHDLVEIVLAALLAATLVAALHVALGLVFDPRYKDFPFAALAGPVIALAVLGLATARAPVKPGAAEAAAAIVLTASALFVIVNEGIANWQALVLAGLLLLLALTTLQAKAVPG
ncbi:MAG TPA: beta-1,6-glucan synthase [Methyloceanibacter sp.]|nr:beta-1,6-glucan synthase [Methyloceanibacter sp.]